MASNMNLVSFECHLRQNFALFFCCKLNRVDSVAWHRIAQEHVLESIYFSDVVVVGDVDTKWATVCRKADDLERGEVRSQKLLFFHILWPRQKWDNVFRISNKRLEFL